METGGFGIGAGDDARAAWKLGGGALKGGGVAVAPEGVCSELRAVAPAGAANDGSAGVM